MQNIIFAGHINALNSIEIKDLNFIQPTFEENMKYIMKLKVGVNSLFIIMLLHIYLSWLSCFVIQLYFYIISIV